MIRNKYTEKSPTGDERIMRTKKGAIFASSPLSSEKFETANFILSKHCKGMLENNFYP